MASLSDLVFRVSSRDGGHRPRFGFCRNHESAKARLGGERLALDYKYGTSDRREAQLEGPRTETW